MMNKPKVRIKGFEEEWEQTTFDDIASLRRGLTYTPSDIQSNGVRVLRSSNIQDDLFVLNDDDVFVNPNAVNINYANTDDILITAANGSKNLVGKHCIIKSSTGDGLMVHGGFMLLAECSNPAFLNASMSAPWFRKEVALNSAGGNGSISNLNKSQVNNFHLYAPNDEEQAKIGLYFQSFDTLISTSQDKLNKLKSLKICYLNRLFPIGGGKIPPIRLAGFSGEWKRCQLKEFLSIEEDIAQNNYTKEDVLSVSGEQGVVNQIAFQGRSFAGNSICNYRVVKSGNVVYTKSPLKANPYGIVKTAKKEEGIVSPLYAVYNANENCDPDFVQIYFENKDRLNLYLRPLVNKGAKNTILISDETALEGDVVFPEKEEQHAIAEFFNEMDSLISLYSEELERLKSLKQSCLESMFVNP